MLKLSVLVILATLLAISHAGDEFSDHRCICICPSFSVINEKPTDGDRKIYIDIMNKEDCTCEKVLESWKPNQTAMLTGFCPRCNCRFEVRNTTTMKIVVIIIICVLALLFIYMGFLLCLDPLMSTKFRQNPAYQPQRNDELNMDSAEDQFNGIYQSENLAHSSRSNVINRVSQEQSKWKRQVQEQRRTVYDKHVILN